MKYGICKKCSEETKIKNNQVNFICSNCNAKNKYNQKKIPARKYEIYLQPDKKEFLTLRQIARRLKIPIGCIRSRVTRNGIDCCETFKPYKKTNIKNEKRISICLDGKKEEFLSRCEIADRLGINRVTINTRIRRKGINCEDVYNPKILY